MGAMALSSHDYVSELYQIRLEHPSELPLMIQQSSFMVWSAPGHAEMMQELHGCGGNYVKLQFRRRADGSGRLHSDSASCFNNDEWVGGALVVLVRFIRRPCPIHCGNCRWAKVQGSPNRML